MQNSVQIPENQISLKFVDNLGGDSGKRFLFFDSHSQYIFSLIHLPIKNYAPSLSERYNYMGSHMENFIDPMTPQSPSLF